MSGGPFNGNTKTFLAATALIIQLITIIWAAAVFKTRFDILQLEFKEFKTEMRAWSADARDDLDDHISIGIHSKTHEKQAALDEKVRDHESRLRDIERKGGQ